MPAPESSASQESKPAVATVDTAALGASIADGIAKNLAPILERSAQPARSESAAPPPAPVVLPEPSFEEINAAQEAGDFKTANKLMQQRERARDARNQSAFDQLRNQGASALSSMARQAAASLPHYTRFQKEIDEMIADFQGKNPGVMITPDHYRTAHDIIMGRHVEDIAKERTEEALRKARETPVAVDLGEGDDDATGGEKLPATVAEEFAGTPFIKQFQTKARAVGGRNFEQEVQIMNRGIKAARLMDEKGRPKRDYTEKDYLKERREMAAIYEDNPSLGLDE